MWCGRHFCQIIIFIQHFSYRKQWRMSKYEFLSLFFKTWIHFALIAFFIKKYKTFCFSDFKPYLEEYLQDDAHKLWEDERLWHVFHWSSNVEGVPWSNVHLHHCITTVCFLVKNTVPSTSFDFFVYSSLAVAPDFVFVDLKI